MNVVESHKGSNNHPEHHGTTVTVTVDTKEKHVHSGNYVVSAFKQLVGVAEERVLDEVIKGELVELKDDQPIQIKGGEKFISHARDGKSS